MTLRSARAINFLICYRHCCINITPQTSVHLERQHFFKYPILAHQWALRHGEARLIRMYDMRPIYPLKCPVYPQKKLVNVYTSEWNDSSRRGEAKCIGMKAWIMMINMFIDNIEPLHLASQVPDFGTSSELEKYVLEINHVTNMTTVLQCVAVYCSVLQCVVVKSLKEAAIRRVYLCCNMCCIVLQCVAVTSLKEYATRRVLSSTRLTHILLPAHKRNQNRNTKEINIKSYMQCVAVFRSHVTEEICHSLLHPFDEWFALCTHPQKSKFFFPKELLLPKRRENSRALRKTGLFLW